MAATRRRRAQPEDPVPAMKRCPACAESVREEAVICRYCRYDLLRGRLSSRTNPASVASLTLGIVALFPLLAFPPACFVAAAVALGFGIVGRRQTDARRGWERGGALAVAGIVLGIIGLVMGFGLTALLIAGTGEFHFDAGPFS